MPNHKLVYTKDNCPECIKLKAKFKILGEPYTEIKIGRDITREEFMHSFPDVRTVPFVIELNGEYQEDDEQQQEQEQIG
jgi:glutaredoxin